MDFLTSKEAEYLKILYSFWERGEEVVGPRKIVSILRVSTPTVVEVLKRLASKDLVIYLDWKGVKLSEKGLKIAESIVRSHRILEILFVNTGVDLESACRSASLIDSRISDSVIDRICEHLDHPNRCPHGYLIPRKRECCERGR